MSGVTLDLDISQFVESARQQLLTAADAIKRNDIDAFVRISERASTSDPARRVTAWVTTSTNALESFLQRVERGTPLTKVIGGLTIVGAGAILWGTTIALAQVIGFCLMFIGITIALPAMWEIIAARFDQLWDSLPSI